MKWEIVLTEKMHRDLQDHLLRDRSQEQMAVTLCGVSRCGKVVRLLGRHLVLMPPDAFVYQHAAGVELKPEVQSYVLELAAREGLSQVDWHSHPGCGKGLGFSGIDDRYEQALARYLSRVMPGTHYASVVVNDEDLAARIWLEAGSRAKAVDRIALGGLTEWLPSSGVTPGKLEEQFSRQVLAFGRSLQDRLSRLMVGVVGLGGLGSILVEELSRLGVAHWVLVDSDVIEETNLNRVTGSTLSDAKTARGKVTVAMRNIHRVNPWARVTAMRSSVLEPRVLGRLKGCDLLVVCTDNDSSRLVTNRIAAQYLIPLLHVGYAIEAGDGKVTEVSGEYAITAPGEWCLFCSSIVDGQAAARELASPKELAILRDRGYVADTPAPAVYHLDGIIASLAAAEVHNLAHPYRSARRYLVYDDIKGELMPVTVEPQDGCPVCSPDGVLGLGDLEPLPAYCGLAASESQMPPAGEEDSIEEGMKEASECQA